MPAGTISLTNNSDKVTGSGTSFNEELNANDFIVAVVGGVTYTLGVKSVESDSSLTLIKNFRGPTYNGLAWTPLPAKTLALIHAELATLTTDAVRGFNLDKSNWQQIFSADNNITVTLPDGSEFKGPSWLKIVELLKDIDIQALEQLAANVSEDAEQVSQDKSAATDAAAAAAEKAEVATQKAEDASQSASEAEQSETNAKTSETNAAKSAANAKTDADRAEAAAGNIEFSMNDVKAYADAACPIGMKLDWPQLTLPDNAALGIKFLRLNGASFDKALYPRLALIYPSGVLPDMRGNVARGYDDGRGVDQGRALLSEQLDALQNITGSFVSGRNTQTTGAFSLGSAETSVASVAAGSEYVRNFDASRVARTANETRMRNIAWNMIVRAS